MRTRLLPGLNVFKLKTAKLLQMNFCRPGGDSGRQPVHLNWCVLVLHPRMSAIDCRSLALRKRWICGGERMNPDQNAATMAIAADNWGWLVLALVVGVIAGWMIRGRFERQS